MERIGGGFYLPYRRLTAPLFSNSLTFIRYTRY
jgi:hypothetical protein